MVNKISYEQREARDERRFIDFMGRRSRVLAIDSEKLYSNATITGL